MSAWVAGLATLLGVLVIGGATPRRRPEAPPAVGSARADLVALATGWLDRVWPAGRSARRDAQLPEALDRLASSLRAGHALGPALVRLSTSMSGPLGDELRPVAGAIAHGAPVAGALGGWAATPGASSDVGLVAAALTLGADAGGETARAVDRIAVTLRERREVRGEVRALATQARASAGVLVAAPLAFTALVATIEPGAVAFLVTTPVGLACLVAGLGLEGLGAAWMARITRSVA